MYIKYADYKPDFNPLPRKEGDYCIMFFLICQ